MSPLYEHLNQPEGRWLRDSILLLILFGFLFLNGLGSAPLIDPDEGRYAEIPREMLERVDFVTPTLNYVKYFEKPPLLYWVNAASMAALGKNEFAARLPSALSGLFTVLLTYLAGRQLFSRRTGMIGALILGSCAAFLFQSRIILTDMLLTLCLSAALFSFLLAAQSRGPYKNNLYRLFFICCGLAVLTKGLIGIVLPGGIIFWYLLLGKRWHLLREIPWLSGMLLFALVTVPWFVLVSLANPEFAHFFFIREHFQRYTSTIHKRSQPFWFFLPILVLTMLPWSFFLPRSLKNAWQQRNSTKGITLFLLLWPCVIILFFSLSSSKLIPYILPTFPPLALLVADYVNGLRHQRKPPVSAPVWIFILLLALLSIVAITGENLSVTREYLQSIPFLTRSTLHLFSIFFLCTASVLLIALRIRSTTAVISSLTLFGIILGLLLPKLYAKNIAEELSSKIMAQTAIRHSTPDTILAQIGPYQGMNFYTNKRLMTVFLLDELAFGSQQGNQSPWFPNLVEFLQLWKSDRHMLLVLPRTDVANFSNVTGTKPVIVMETTQRSLISNH